MTARPSHLSVVRLLLRVAFLRWRNRIGGALARRGAGKKGDAFRSGRTATPGKRRSRPAVTVLLLFATVVMAFTCLHLSFMVVGRIVHGAAGRNRDGVRPGTASSLRDIAEDLEDLERWPSPSVLPGDVVEVRGAAEDVDVETQRRNLLVNARKLFFEEIGRKAVIRREGRRWVLAFPEGPPTGEEAEKVDAWMRAFEEKGAEAVPETEEPQVLPFGKPLFPGLGARRRVVCSGLSALIGLLWFTLLFFHLGSGNQDLGQVEWALEWLFTFPAPAVVLFASKIVEYALFNLMGWFLLLPFCFALFWHAGFGWAGLAPALVVTVYLLVTLACPRLLFETFLRKRVSRSRLKNLQAVFALAGIVCFFGVMYTAMREPTPPWFFEAAASLPGALAWTWWGMPVLLSRGGLVSLAGWGLLVAYAGLFLFLGLGVTSRLVRDGLVSQTGAYQGSRTRIRRAIAGSRWMLRGIVLKDLRLLYRDRALLVQSFVVPLFIVSMNVLINKKMLTSVAADFRHLSALAFAMGSYVMMFSAFNGLKVEGRSLWLLYTFPQGLKDILARKALLWSVVSLIYPAAILAAGLARQDALRWDAAVNTDTVLAGVFIYGFIAAGLGALSTDPQATDPRKQISVASLYAYMLLAGIYVFSIYAPGSGTKLGIVLFSAMAAVAVWQRVEERMPYLLEPVAEPPPRLTLAHGLIASYVYFVILGIVRVAAGGAMFFVLLAPLVAGTIVVPPSLVLLWNRGIPRLREQLGLRRRPGGPGWGRAAGSGLVFGVLAGAVGILYLLALGLVPSLRELRDVSVSRWRGFTGPELAGFVGLTVVAAPLIEEYLFRALIFRGLAKTFRPVAAVAVSAGLFAVVHPPLSIAPVFVLGVAAALGYRRSGLLVAPIVTHAVYNAAVVSAHFLL